MRSNTCVPSLSPLLIPLLPLLLLLRPLLLPQMPKEPRDLRDKKAKEQEKRRFDYLAMFNERESLKGNDGIIDQLYSYVRTAR